VPATDARGFSCLTDLEDGTLAFEPTPTEPHNEPRRAHDKRRMFERAFEDQKLTLADLSPYRVRVAWRAVRWISVKLGALPPELLLGGMPEQPGDATNGLDLLYRPHLPDQFRPLNPDRPTRKLMEIVRECCRLCDPVPYERLHPNTDAIVTDEKPGFTLLPTAQTAEFWVKAFDVAAEYLFLARGSKKNKDQGRYGMLGLTDPQTAAIACPVPTELMFWEVFLVDEALKMFASKGEHIIDANLREFYGLLPDETRPVLDQARRIIRDRTDLDVNERRALMVLQINDVIARAQESVDHRAELAALKLRSQIEGITRSEPEDLNKMFRKIVTDTTRERRNIDYTGDRLIEMGTTKETEDADERTDD
jgi:hypothetical protein